MRKFAVTLKLRGKVIDIRPETSIILRAFPHPIQPASEHGEEENVEYAIWNLIDDEQDTDSF